MVVTSDCIGCGGCADVCPHDAITLKNYGASIDQTKCEDCGWCADQCPGDAIKVSEQGR
jgi:Fe-S-cluster-containing hydrogenase component 2